MGCFDECMDGLMEPYGGNMPLFKNADTTDATVTIVQESYDDGMSITRINTPPRTDTRSLIDVINNVLNTFGLMDFGKDKPEDKEKDDGDKDDSRVQSGKQSQNRSDNRSSDSDMDRGGFGQSGKQEGVDTKDKTKDSSSSH